MNNHGRDLFSPWSCSSIRNQNPSNAVLPQVKTLLLLLFAVTFLRAAERPNIVFIMADDQGYGDASSYNPESKIPTPGLDRIAKEGIRFTDAHSGSAVCSPTRYGLLTGRYSWRSRLQSGVLVTGEKGGGLIAPSILTVPEFLREQGYKTALVGKWHLGYRYEFPAGDKGLKRIETKKTYGKFSAMAAPIGSKIMDGPVEHGFDEFHGFHHAREMHSWAKNDMVTENIPLDQVIARATDHSIRFIEETTKTSKPFFLYLALGSPHTPIVPSEKWVGKSGISEYADFVMETDHATVQILEALDRLKIADNTLIIFTADNGCSPAANIKQLLEKGHDPSYSLRGTKADAWDGGHRVPYVARWPRVIKPNRVSDELICHNNLMATCAEILATKLPDSAGVDSFSILPVLRGDEIKEPTHPYVIHHSASGRFAVRKGSWKFLACKGSGGWSKGNDGKPSQLYNMAIDRKETNNLVDDQPDVTEELTKLLESAITNGRTTPGPKQKNDAKIVIWKDRAGAKKKPKKEDA
jgi:arylsulfatase A